MVLMDREATEIRVVFELLDWFLDDCGTGRDALKTQRPRAIGQRSFGFITMALQCGQREASGGFTGRCLWVQLP